MTTVPYRRPPAFEKPRGATFSFGGFVGKRLGANLENWLLTAVHANPAMLQMFRDRERTPSRDLLPWSGEFVGKYLISAIQSWRILHDERLRELIEQVVAELIASQGDDGYLGPFTRDLRLTSDRWDVWGHYHWIQALLMHWEDTGDTSALDACCRAADLIHRTFVGTGARMLAPEQNLAILHGACLLYRATGERRYRELAEWVVAEQSREGSCRYLEDAASGKEIQDFHSRRWEGLHCIQGFAELGWLTGETVLLDAFRHIWWEMLKGDRHNTGGFTSGEACQGNPYHQGAIETCCTVAWVALTLDMLRLTGDSRIADELELSTFNGILGAQHPSGRWWTYNTPMDGVRRANAHDIVFQARPGSPELNCCSVNAPRGLGMLAGWAVMSTSDGVVLNYFGASRFRLSLPSGNIVTLEQATDYPNRGDVSLCVTVDRPETFAVYLRVPEWSAQTTVALDGQEFAVEPGSYYRIEREWRSDARLDLKLDLTPYFWVGERELAGRTSLARGPVVLTYDRYFNEMDPDDVPTLDAAALELEAVSWDGWVEPWTLFRTTGCDGRRVLLCDYASAGATGTPYRTWLPIRGVEPVPFSRTCPKRMARRR
jgi:hypothetical protein